MNQPKKSYLHFIFSISITFSAYTFADNSLHSPNENEYFELLTVIDIADYPMAEHCASTQTGVTTKDVEDAGIPQLMFIPANINNDAYKDLFVMYWCGLQDPALRNVVHYEEQVTYVIPYVSDSAGNYTAQPKKILGENFPILGAHPRRYEMYDFNNDGREDYAFAMNWDDGRKNQEVPKQAILLSAPNNTYEIQYYTTTQPVMAHSLTLVNNIIGTKDIVWGVYGGGPNLQAARYVDGYWVDVSSEYPDVFRKIKDSNSDFGTETIAINTNVPSYLVSHRQVRNNQQQIVGYGLNLWSKSSGEWILSDFIQEELFDFINYQSWGDDFDVNKMGIALVNGKEMWTSQVFTQAMCMFQDNGESLALAFRGGKVVKDNGTFDREEIYTDNHPDLENISQIQLFNTAGEKITRVDYQIINPAFKESGNFYQCRDVNNDGLMDLVHETFSNTWRTDFQKTNSPQIYINRGNRVLQNVNYDVDGLLLNDNNFESFVGKLHDINDDGIEDLIRISNKIEVNKKNQDGAFENSIRIYLGKKDIGNPRDTDGDAIPDTCDAACIQFGMSADSDDDGDGVLDTSDAYPLISLGGLVDTDTDSDGAPDTCDSACIALGMSSDLDDDNDGYSDEYEISVGSDPLDGDMLPMNSLDITIIQAVLMKNKTTTVPKANAGADQTVVTGELVTLNGSASNVVNSDVINYSWAFSSIPSGSSATLSDANLSNPQFTTDIEGTYVLTLIVDDGKESSSSVSVTIIAEPLSPIFESELNDNSTLANQALFNVDLQGYLTNSGDQDWFYYDLSTPNVYVNVTFDVSSITGLGIWNVTWLDPDMKILSQRNIFSPEGFNYRIPANRTGKYYLRVMQSNPTFNNGGIYTIKTSIGPGPW